MHESIASFMPLLYSTTVCKTARIATARARQVAWTLRILTLLWNRELSNENNALVDGWFANSSAGCDPSGSKGTPLHRSDADNFDTAQMIATHAWLAEKIRAADPGRLVNSGNSLPRPSAEHWRNTPREDVAHHRIDSRPDNESDFCATCWTQTQEWTSSQLTLVEVRTLQGGRISTGSMALPNRPHGC
jgi:hypothetical protein